MNLRVTFVGKVKLLRSGAEAKASLNRAKQTHAVRGSQQE